jgi:hypothetical protein
MALADAYRAAGNEGRAALEYRAALATFDRLGATLDARLATEALGQAAAPRPAPKQVNRTFMFTDIVRSTNLVEALGDEAWGHLIRWHDEQLRSQFAAHRGEVVKAIGDGFFVAFQSASEAVECAVAIQRALQEHRRAHGFAPQVRIGVHAASATHERLDYRGKGVNAAAESVPWPAATRSWPPPRPLPWSLFDRSRAPAPLPSRALPTRSRSSRSNGVDVSCRDVVTPACTVVPRKGTPV